MANTTKTVKKQTKSTQKSMDDVKAETLKLYASLPDDIEERKKCTDIRDRIIELNYPFFGYVARTTYVNNNTITYDDKLQSALLHFCEIWWKYGLPEYRQDLSFSVFFKLRLSEMIDRELTEVKYSILRSLTMEVGQQVGKHWAKVRYEDLAKVDLPIEKINSLKAIFGVLYFADLETHLAFTEAPKDTSSEFDDPSDKFRTVQDLLVYEMVTRESLLSDEDLQEIAQVHSIDIGTLRRVNVRATEFLYEKLHRNIDSRM